VEVADRQRDVIQRGQRVAMLGLEAGQDARQECLGVAVAAVSGDHQAPTRGVQRSGGIGVAEGVAEDAQNAIGGMFRRKPRIASAPDQGAVSDGSDTGRTGRNIARTCPPFPFLPKRLKGEVPPPSHGAKLRMRDLEIIDSELRLLAAVRRVCRELGGTVPSMGPVDALLDERNTVT
jgi:hypothetical protein